MASHIGGGLPSNFLQRRKFLFQSGSFSGELKSLSNSFYYRPDRFWPRLPNARIDQNDLLQIRPVGLPALPEIIIDLREPIPGRACGLPVISRLRPVTGVALRSLLPERQIPNETIAFEQ